MNRKALREAIDTYKEILRLHQLNLELLETLEFSLLWLKDFSEKHNLLIPNRKNIASLLRKANSLLNEISSPPILQHQRAIRRKFTRNKSDKDFTERQTPSTFSVFWEESTEDQRRMRLYRNRKLKHQVSYTAVDSSGVEATEDWVLDKERNPIWCGCKHRLRRLQ